MSALIQRLIANKHTSAAATLYIVGKFGVKFVSIWFPGHDAQCEQTADLIEAAAVSYGLFMAGDSKPVPEGGQQQSNEVTKPLTTGTK
jgi:hypothetical protein